MTLNETLTLFSRSRYSLTLNISQTATDTAIVTIEGEYETEPKLSSGTNFNLLVVCVSFTIIGQPRNSVLIRRV